MKNFKLIKLKIAFFSIPIALLSLEIYFGVIFGYIIFRICCGKESGKRGITKSIVFNIGDWRLHIHHWLIGSAVLVFALILKYSLPFSPFSFGFLGGLVIQGIFDYADWHRVLIKDPKL